MTSAASYRDPGHVGEPLVEQVVLLDEAGRAVGTADKLAVHHEATPLHLAFSCYVFDSLGRLLVTRRALDKPTFPGVWSNTACGHPGPGEPLVEAARRRVGEELRLGLRDLRVVLPAFRYRAAMANGVVENEMCPVVAAVTPDQPVPDPDEVADTAWVPWPEFSRDVLDGHREVSVWCLEQVRQLVLLGDEPAHWSHSTTSLPPAAR